MISEEDLEKATTLVKALSDLSDKIKPEVLQALIYFCIAFTAFLIVKAVLRFFIDRRDLDTIERNTHMLGRVSQALDHVTHAIQGCGKRGENK